MNSNFIFPKTFGDRVAEEGLSKRELFAVLALQGLLAAGSPPLINGTPMGIEDAAVVLADALIAKLGAK